MIVGADDAKTAAGGVAAEGLADDLGIQVIETGGGLIQEQDGRFLDEGAGDRGALLLPAGKSRGAAVRVLLQAEQGEPAAGAGQGFVMSQPGEAPGHLEVARHRREREQVQLLEHETELPPLKFAVAGVLAERGLNLALRRAEIAGHEAEQGGFAAPARALDEGDARLEFMREAADDPIVLAGVAEGNLPAENPGGSPPLARLGDWKGERDGSGAVHWKLPAAATCFGKTIPRSVCPSATTRAPGKSICTAAAQVPC